MLVLFIDSSEMIANRRGDIAAQRFIIGICPSIIRFSIFMYGRLEALD